MLSLPAGAIPTKKINWHCQLSANLNGDDTHFWESGQDAWKGSGSMVCEGGGQSLCRKVAVAFNSLYEGFGANQTATLDMQVDMSTSMSPNEFQVRSVVSDRDLGPSVRWAFSSQLSEGRVFVTAFQPDLAVYSVQRGNLLIRSAGECTN